MKKDLSQIDLISINCVNPSESIAAIEYCARFFTFGKSILITDQFIEHPDITIINISSLTWNSYNDFVLKLIDYSDNDYVMLIQDDGHIVNPDLWDDSYLDYDYIGAPWPIEESWISLQFPDQQNIMRDIFPKNRVGNGGFCLRSKKFLQFSSQFNMCEGIGEDSYLCTSKYLDAIDYGIKFAPLELSMKFSYENPLGNWDQKINFDEAKHFGWHGKNFINTSYLLNLKHTI